MAFVQATPFTFRDFLQSILPGLIAASLFAPYAGAKSTEEFLIGIALLSYVIYTPMSWAARLFFGVTPVLRQKIKYLERERDWHARNWDYTRLFYFASTEDREYIYLTGAYTQFYRLTALYFVIYLFVQLGRLIGALNPFLIDIPLSRWPSRLFEARTPLLGNWEIPTILAAIAAAIILWFLVADFLNEHQILFQDQYVEIARKYHADKGGIALSIWGSVTEDWEGKEPITDAKVFLEDHTAAIIQERNTGKDGRFQFVGLFKSSVESGYTLRVEKGNRRLTTTLPKDEKWAPPVLVVLPQPPTASNQPVTTPVNQPEVDAAIEREKIAGAGS
jgi:hypothetical protein